MYRYFLHTLLSGCTVLVVIAANCHAADVPKANKQPNPPNILLIVADDMGFTDIGRAGGEINTPNIDQLAQDGITFPNFYNMARCWPSRASLLTGRYPHEVGMGGQMQYTDDKGHQFPDEPEGPFQGYLSFTTPTIPEVLRSKGYKSYAVGKWHMGEQKSSWPTNRGFDHYFGPVTGTDSYFSQYMNPTRKRTFLDDGKEWQVPESDYYATTEFTKRGAAMLKQHAAQYPDSPFFFYAAYTAPHWPLHALPQDIAKYDGHYAEGWDVLRQRRFDNAKKRGMLPQNAQLPARPDSIPAWDSLTATEKVAWADRMEVYAAMVDRLDAGIGKLIATLKETGQLDNTVILFFSDNGASKEDLMDHEIYRKINDPTIKVGAKGSIFGQQEPWANVSNAPYRYYKKYMFEGGIKSPLIINWPHNIRDGGAINTSVGHVVDLMPMVLNVSGAAYPTAQDGSLSVLPGVDLLDKNQQTDKRKLYWSHFGQHAMRDAEWKIIRIDEESWQLYNLHEDPTEINNVAQANPKIVAHLSKEFDLWLQTQLHTQ
jgi:arylsulfatase